MNKTVLLIATYDIKEETRYLEKRIESRGLNVLTMNAGTLTPPKVPVGVAHTDVLRRGGMSIEAALADRDKGACILNMIRGVEILCKELYEKGRFHGVVGIGDAQGTDIGCAAMRKLLTGIPKLIVSTVASGMTPFAPFVGTRDITMMHSVADIQGLNFLTKRILENVVGAICGMLDKPGDLRI